MGTPIQSNSPEFHLYTESLDSFPADQELKYSLETPNRILTDRVDAFRNELNQLPYPAGVEILDAVHMLTMNDLEKGLFVCSRRLNELLQGNSYALGIIPKKSQEYVATLAKPFLESLPTQVFATASDKGGTQSHLGALTTRNLVVFDDASYSGSQLLETCRALTSSLDPQNQPYELYFVVPFLSSVAKDKIEKAFKESTSNGNLTLITSDKPVQILPDFLTEEEIQVELTRDNNSRSLSTTLTEWKVPDGRSVHIYTKGACHVPMLLNKSNQLVEEYTPPYKKKDYVGGFSIDDEFATR